MEPWSSCEATCGLLQVRRRLQDGAPPGRSGPRPVAPSRADAEGPCRRAFSLRNAGRIEGRAIRLQKETSPGAPFRLQRRHVYCRAAGFLRSSTASLSLRRQALTETSPTIAEKRPFRPAQLFRAAIGRVPVPAQTADRQSSDRAGTDTGKDNGAITLDQRQVGAKILVQNHHAHDDSAWQIALRRKTAPCGASPQRRRCA